jgi:uncharacterized protein YukE
MLHPDTEEIRRGARELSKITHEARSSSYKRSTHAESVQWNGASGELFKQMTSNQHGKMSQLCDKLEVVAQQLLSHATQVDGEIHERTKKSGIIE